MNIEQATRIVQNSYPRIYLACHTRHDRSQTSKGGLSRREAQVVQHLDTDPPYRAGALARHLGVGAPALSAKLDRLEELGLVRRQAYERDRRQTELLLTAKGRKIVQAASVLESERVATLLKRLTEPELATAVAGLEILGRVATDFMDEHGGSSEEAAR